jgi:uncharacterized membrane protein YeiH
MNDFVVLFDIIGTVAFAISGAITGAKYNYDLFGVTALGVLTATAGGILRDVILGSFPPAAFVDPVYVLTAAVTSVIVFYIVKAEIKSGKTYDSDAFRFVLLLGDSIGLGIFTTTGINIAIVKYGCTNGFLAVFSGVVTGVGGGVLRDMMVNTLPEIFTRHIYAVASIVGGVIAWVLMKYGMTAQGIYGGAFLIVLIRFLAEHYRWSLPKLRK